MEIYCVKDRRKTSNVPGSERETLTKNGRRLLKAKCAVCGITKTRFLRGKMTTGLGVPGSFGVPNIDQKLLTAFGKAVPNHRGYMDIAKKTLKNYYGSGTKKNEAWG